MKTNYPGIDYAAGTGTNQDTKTGRQINFDGRFSISGYRGIAFYLIGYAKQSEPIMCYALDDDGNETEIESGEFEEIDNPDFVIAIMVGDDRRHQVSVDDLTEIDEESYCPSCGQIGCRHGRG